MKRLICILFSFSCDVSFSQAVTDSVFISVKGIGWLSTHPETVNTFSVQQYRWNKWVNIVELNSEPDKKYYLFPVTFHGGENKFRIVYAMKDGKEITSKEYIYEDPLTKKSPDFTIEQEMIILSDTCAYEVYDKFGNIKLKGKAKKFSIKELEPDVYYLNYGNVTTEFIKHRKKSRHVKID